jgi:3',5'-cyclic AMP phosphodiesterase CpdA
MRLVHLTDPHLSHLEGVNFSMLWGKRWSGYLSWFKNRQKKHLKAVLEKLTDAVRAENADQILLTGDLIQIGLDSEISQATEWLAALGPAEQIMLVPGNHDIYAKGSADAACLAWSEYLFHDNQAGSAGALGQFPVSRKLGQLSLIALSTACVTPIFMASGKLGQQQLDKLAELLQHAANENQMVCLLIHHPPLPGMTIWRKALADADALQAVLEIYPPVMIFHGHLHHNREQQWGDSHIYCTAAASSVSEASYRVIDIEEKGDSWAFRMRLKSVAIDDAGVLKFLTVDEHSWQIKKKMS